MRWSTVGALFLSGCYSGIAATGDTEGDEVHDPSQAMGSEGTDEGPQRPEEEPSTEDDVGRIALHRLTRAQYEHTLADLLHLEDLPAATFIRGGTGVGFPNEAKLLRDIPEDLARGYIEHAREVVGVVFANPDARARVSSCTPETDDDTACAEAFVASFGLRAWRRPVEPQETERLIAHYREVRDAGGSHDDALAVLTRMFLGSPHFVFHVELDEAPDETAPHRLDAYALASRLSYTIWNSMPDDDLFAQAKDGTLFERERLHAEVDRMLADPKGTRFREAFVETWVRVPLLDAQALLIDTEVYPAWSAELGDDMRAELVAYLDDFVHDDLPWSTFLTADVNFVTERLAEHYGMPWTGDAGTVRVEGYEDQRVGYLGLAGFLTYSSRSARTAPTFRGKLILEALSCTALMIPPNVPELEMDDESGTEFPSIREQLEAHRAAPECAACHNLLDPPGLVLENFDAIGAWRETYEDGYPIDPRTTFQETDVASLIELAPEIAKTKQFLNCPVEKMLTFALRRTPEGDDRAFIREISETWNGGSLRDLLKAVVLHDAFQWRRGEAPE